MDEIIRTEKLCRYFGKFKAVDDISINIRKGEIYGFLGLNGAGKTTTIRMLLGMIRPTSGASYLNGKLVTAGNHKLWEKVGSLVEIPYSYPDLTVIENLEIIRRLRQLKDKHIVNEIIERLAIGPYKDVLARNLSLGNSQRLGLAKAMMHDPEILILDEPANGLDPAGIVEIREMLKYLAEKDGATIFISSHILGEISKFATRIGIIHEGELILESAVDEMEKLRNHRLLVKTQDLNGAKSVLGQNGYDPILEESGILEMHNEEAIKNPEKIASLLVHSGFPPSLIQVKEEDLETFFLRVISEKGGFG